MLLGVATQIKLGLVAVGAVAVAVYVRKSLRKIAPLPEQMKGMGIECFLAYPFSCSANRVVLPLWAKDGHSIAVPAPVSTHFGSASSLSEEEVIVVSLDRIDLKRGMWGHDLSIGVNNNAGRSTQRMTKQFYEEVYCGKPRRLRRVARHRRSLNSVATMKSEGGQGAGISPAWRIITPKGVVVQVISRLQYSDVLIGVAPRHSMGAETPDMLARTLARVDTQSLQLVRRSQGEVYHPPVLSPDGQYFAFVAESNGLYIWRVPEFEDDSDDDADDDLVSTSGVSTAAVPLGPRQVPYPGNEIVDDLTSTGRVSTRRHRPAMRSTGMRSAGMRSSTGSVASVTSGSGSTRGYLAAPSHAYPHMPGPVATATVTTTTATATKMTALSRASSTRASPLHAERYLEHVDDDDVVDEDEVEHDDDEDEDDDDEDQDSGGGDHGDDAQSTDNPGYAVVTGEVGSIDRMRHSSSQSRRHAGQGFVSAAASMSGNLSRLRAHQRSCEDVYRAVSELQRAHSRSNVTNQEPSSRNAMRPEELDEYIEEVTDADGNEDAKAVERYSVDVHDRSDVNSIEVRRSASMADSLRLLDGHSLRRLPEYDDDDDDDIEAGDDGNKDRDEQGRGRAGGSRDQSGWLDDGQASESAMSSLQLSENATSTEDEIESVQSPRTYKPSYGYSVWEDEPRPDLSSSKYHQAPESA